MFLQIKSFVYGKIKKRNLSSRMMMNNKAQKIEKVSASLSLLAPSMHQR